MRLTMLGLVFLLLLPSIIFAALAEVPRTGQTTSYASGDDGDLQAGVAVPDPRFTNNNDGTITDNLTGLIWLANANCFDKQNWAAALYSANNLVSGACGLSDGSTTGAWRLPNITELESLFDAERHTPTLPVDYSSFFFTGVASNYYWSSSTHAYYTDNAWYFGMGNGVVGNYYKTSNHYAWPVRGGQ